VYNSILHAHVTCGVCDDPAIFSCRLCPLRVLVVCVLIRHIPMPGALTEPIRAESMLTLRIEDACKEPGHVTTLVTDNGAFVMKEEGERDEEGFEAAASGGIEAERRREMIVEQPSISSLEDRASDGIIVTTGVRRSDLRISARLLACIARHAAIRDSGVVPIPPCHPT
jgi:hypothetical protein